MTAFANKREMICSVLHRPPPKLPPMKIWKPKCKNLPVLQSYPRKLPASYWLNWNKRTFEQVLPTSSWVASGKLRELCTEVGYKDHKRLNKVCTRLVQGADIGCRGRGRLPTVSRNSPSVSEYGARVADSLQEWVDKGRTDLAFCTFL